jgi:hypothetical protein
MASWADVKAPTPARVPWHSESWPAMPVMRVMESSTVESASPALKAASQVVGIQVSMETQKSARRTHQARRMIRSICGALEAAAVGGGVDRWWRGDRG